MAVLGLGCCTRPFSSHGERSWSWSRFMDLLLRLLLLLHRGSRVRGLQLWHLGLVALWHMGSFQTRDQTGVFALEGRFLTTEPLRKPHGSILIQQGR